MMLLVMMGLAANMTFTAKSQSHLASSAKLQQFYETAALTVFNRTRAGLLDHWVDVDPLSELSNDWRWRFGVLLDEASKVSNLTHGNYPATDEDYRIEMNSGMLELTYKIWVTNNPDDPAVLYQGVDLDRDAEKIQTLTANYDLDGKIVLSVEVFGPTNPNVPIVTQSALLGPVGGEYGYIHGNGHREGDDSDAGNQGRGSMGNGTAVSISELDTE